MGRVGIDPLFKVGQIPFAGLFSIQFGEPFAGLGLDAFVFRKVQYCAAVVCAVLSVSIVVITHGSVLLP